MKEFYENSIVTMNDILPIMPNPSALKSVLLASWSNVHELKR